MEWKIQKNGLNNHTKKKRRKKVCWLPPTPNYVKVNFDGSVWQDKSTSIGCVIRNERGRVVLVGVKRPGQRCLPTADGGLDNAICLHKGVEAWLWVHPSER